MTILKTVAGLCAVTVFSLCAQRDKPSAAKRLRKLLLTDKALKLIAVDSAGGDRERCMKEISEKHFTLLLPDPVEGSPLLMAETGHVYRSYSG